MESDSLVRHDAPAVAAPSGGIPPTSNLGGSGHLALTANHRSSGGIPRRSKIDRTR